MNTEKQYLQAFNNGYILERYDPELLNVVTQNLIPSNLFLKGLFEGKQQMQIELQEYQLSELRVLRNITHRSNSLDRESE